MSTTCGFSVPPPPDLHYNNPEGAGPSPTASKWTARTGAPSLIRPMRTHGGIHVEPNPNLYIHNVPKDATEQELKKLFSSFGTIERIRLKVNQKIGPQALYAFVTFSSTSEAQMALQRLNGYDMRSRRLRVEFQRLRGDDERSCYSSGNMDYSSPRRGHDVMKRRSSSWGSKVREFGGRDENRKRSQYFPYGPKVNGYGNQYNYDSDCILEGGASYKRARQYDSRRLPMVSRPGYAYNSNERFNGNEPQSFSEPAYPSVEPSSRSWGTSAHPGMHRGHQYETVETNPQGSSGRERVTIYLCELLRHLGLASLFKQGDSEAPTPLHAPQTNLSTYSNVEQANQQQNHFGVSTTLPNPEDFRSNHSYETVEPQPSFGNVHYTDSNLTLPLRPSHVWVGCLARNGRRKVPIKAFPISGAVEKLLSSETQLNISHRSSWNELSRKSLCAVCYFELSDRELEADGPDSYALLTPQKKDLYMKCFKDHIDYFTTKKKAGVVALAENKHLYIVPRGTFFFEQYSPESLPEDVPVLMGLFTQTLVPQGYLAVSREIPGSFLPQPHEDNGSSVLSGNYTTESLQSKSVVSCSQPQQNMSEPDSYTQQVLPSPESSGTNLGSTAFVATRDHEAVSLSSTGEDGTFRFDDPQTPSLNQMSQPMASSTPSHGQSTPLSQNTSLNPAPVSNGANNPSPSMLMSLLSSPRLLEALRATAQLQQSV